MTTLTKQKKLDFIRELVETESITAYTIAKNTNITESGVQRLLNGSTKNPHINTVNGIYKYLSELGTVNVVTLEQTEREQMEMSLRDQYGVINESMFNLMESLVKKIVASETKPQIDNLNEMVLDLFKNQLALDKKNIEAIKKETKLPGAGNGAG